jgi:hypothetical protein
VCDSAPPGIGDRSLPLIDRARRPSSSARVAATPGAGRPGRHPIRPRRSDNVLSAQHSAFADPGSARPSPDSPASQRRCALGFIRPRCSDSRPWSTRLPPDSPASQRRCALGLTCPRCSDSRPWSTRPPPVSSASQRQRSLGLIPPALRRQASPRRGPSPALQRPPSRCASGRVADPLAVPLERPRRSDTLSLPYCACVAATSAPSRSALASQRHPLPPVLRPRRSDIRPLPFGARVAATPSPSRSAPASQRQGRGQPTASW